MLLPWLRRRRAANTLSSSSISRFQKWRRNYFRPRLEPLEVRIAPALLSGGVSVASADVNGDGFADIITGAGIGDFPVVKVFSGNDQSLMRSFYAYDPQFLGGVRVAAGDVDGDGEIDIVTAAGPTGGPHVKAFSGANGSLLHSFFAYDASFRGGVFVAVGDATGDGKADLITGAGADGGPHVRVFNGATGAIHMEFMAYAPQFLGGVQVAAGDVDGDGRSDVITAAGAGGGPHVTVVSGSDGSLLKSFYAYDPAFTGGVSVAAADFDGDARSDIATGAGPGGGPHVRTFSGNNLSEITGFFAYSPAFLGGITLAAGDVNGDSRADLVTGTFSGNPHVRAFDIATGAELAGLMAYDLLPPPLASTAVGVVATPGHSGETALARITFLGANAGFNNESGIHVVDDAEGRVNGLLPGSPGYAAAALDPVRRRPLFANNSQIASTVAVPDGGFVAFYLIQNSTAAAWQASNPGNLPAGMPLAFFSVPAANPDGFAHAQMGAGNVVGWEDMTGGGDRDFNDVVYQVAFDPPTRTPPPAVSAPPRVNLSAPADGLQTNSNITVTGRAIDPDGDLNAVTAQFDNGNFFPVIPDAAGYFSFPSTFALDGSAAGPHTVAVRAMDLAGNASPLVTRTFTITGSAVGFDLTGWTLAESGGTAPGRGSVTVQNGRATLSEGNSFQTTMARAFIVPPGSGTLSFTYGSPTFDTADLSSIKDAFEAALLDDAGRPLVPTYAVGRDAFFNVTDGLPVATGVGVTVTGQSVTLDLSSVPVGTRATLVFRLINNDNDAGTSVRLNQVGLPSMAAAPGATKFFVVDPATDRMFRYGADALEAGQFALPANIPNSRGVASNAAGTRLWVVDAASRVAVFDGSGTSLGSWQATGLANPQGITTDGADLWLVDKNQRRVFHYAAAASRTSGSAIAGSSFVLAANNTSPSDLVSDGTIVWVTDDLADAVFVYTTAGALLGSWLLDSDNSTPSGITRNPAGGNDLWVVDRASRQVFHYPTGGSQRSGSLAASGTFRLSTSSVQPEGIADPPPDNGESLPTIQITAPFDQAQIPVGSSILIHGHVAATAPGAAITYVTINGVPVEVLDAAGNFFAQVQVLPGANRFQLVAFDSLEQSSSSLLTLNGVTAGAVDFSQLTDLTASFQAQYARTSFKESDRTLFADFAVKNLGQYPAGVPLYVAVKNISDPTVRVLNAAGTTPEGLPYYDFTGLVTNGQFLNPGGETGKLSLTFANPSRGRFTYDLEFLGVLNRAPTITSVPVVESHPDRQYSYTVVASDPDSDTLTYRLLAAPTGMSVDNAGRIAWTPTVNQLGNHEIVVRVDDGRGGVAEQSFTISCTFAPPNRPPVFTSTPTIDAVIEQSYVYDADATDPDGDVLTYTLVPGQFPVGMTINSESGVVSWTPTAAQLGDSFVTVLVEDGNGGTAEQTFSICVETGDNRVPVIVSEPVTTVRINDGTTFGSARVIVLPDEWQFTRLAFESAPGSLRLVNNIVEEFTGGNAGHFLAISANVPIVYSGNIYGDSTFGSAEFRAALAARNVDLTIQPTLPTDLEELRQYDAVFLSGYAAPTSMLLDYFAVGGNLLFMGGTGIIDEPVAWNPVLSHFGLQYDSGYDGLIDIIDLQSQDPLFAGVTTLYHGNASFLADSDPEDARGRVAATFLGRPYALVYRDYADSENLLVNGNFEQSTLSGTTFGVPVGSTAITGWTVVEDNIDLIDSTYWQPSDGSYSLDLNGTPGVGGIEQVFNTVSGRSYTVRFDMAGNTGGGPVVKKLLVSAGTQSREFTFDTTGKSAQAMGWETRSWTFVAESSTTVLRFQSLTPENPIAGPALDNVFVVPTQSLAAYVYDVEGLDPDSDTLTYSLLQAPAGMTIDSQTGLVTWIPSGGCSGPQFLDHGLS